MTKRLLVILLALMLLVPVLAEAGGPKPGGTLKFALLRDPTGWDPHLYQGATTFSFMNLIYESLIRNTKNGALEPSLAARWEIPDPTTYLLHLRKGVKFHSGNPFTAEDVKFSLARILDPKTAATRSRLRSASSRSCRSATTATTTRRRRSCSRTCAASCTGWWTRAGSASPSRCGTSRSA